MLCWKPAHMLINLCRGSARPVLAYIGISFLYHSPKCGNQLD